MDKLEQLENKRKEAIEIVLSAMATDGEHHKTWSLDQILQTLAGEEYSNFVKKFEEENGVDWDCGIAQ